MKQSFQNTENLKFKRQHYRKAGHVELIRGGKKFFDLLENLINEAKNEIHMQYYILEADETGKIIIDALIKAAKRSVDVYLVLDSYGSSALPDIYINRMTEAGVNFKWFRPVIRFNNMEFGRRLHHKILAIDEQVALVTGVNIANRYNDIQGKQAWLDFALLVKGLSAKEIKQRCIQIWESPYKLSKTWRKFRMPDISGSIKSESAMIKVSVNDWLRGRNEIYQGYRNAISKSEKEILIVGGYFLPGRILRKAMKEASQRGISISIILTRVSDVMFAKSAEEYLYHWMLKNNIKIFEWQPTIMHGKVASVDGLWSTVGSYNLNYLSNFESIELNMEIIDSGFSSQLSHLMKTIAHDECLQIKREDYYKSFSVFRRIKLRFSYWFARTSMRILNAFSNKPKPT